MLSIVKGWWRWHVYLVGHTEGDRMWLASFREHRYALVFVRAMYCAESMSGDPIDEVRV